MPPPSRRPEQLAEGVRKAVVALAAGFLRQPGHRLDPVALLRLVYQLLFLFVAEDRDVLHAPGTGRRARERYARHYSTARLRRGTAQAGLYRSLTAVLTALGDPGGRPELGLPGLGGIFDGALPGPALDDEDLLTAVGHLTAVRDFRGLGADELGSAYESLLGLVPRLDAAGRTFELVAIAGNNRKISGSYYTPSSLVEALLDATLEPLLDEVVKRAAPERADAALLAVTVCDPACGSGHFLVAAARRIARRVAAARGPDPSPEAVGAALREVVGRCLYGVDLDPMAVELAKIALWLEAAEPGRPLSSLDGHLRHGNALVGATPDVLPHGTRDEADAWCAALTGGTRDEHAFFHWHLEFPEVFAAGGFSCLVGNPPWERIKLQEQEFFAQRDAAIATAGTATARKRLIAALREDPARRELHAEYEAAKRKAEGVSRFLRDSGRNPLTGRGDINTYAVFAETGRTLVADDGRLGLIVPTGIATDATTRFFFQDLVRRGALVALHDFENSAPLFAGVHRSFKFALLSLAGRASREAAADFAFFLRDPAELADPARRFTLTPGEIQLLNPRTGTSPVFRGRHDAELTLRIYRRLPVLAEAWTVSFLRMFDMTNDSRLFHRREELEAAGWTLDGTVFHRDGERMLPLYEGKMVRHYDHRWVALPRYWIASSAVRRRDPWLLGYRNVCRSTDERSLIASALPLAGVGNSMPVILTDRPALLLAALSSFVCDYIVRQKAAGANLNFFILEQIPVPTPETLSRHGDFILPRVLELCYTAADLAGLATDLGDTGAPFVRDDARRELLRAELDALFLHLYGASRDDAAYIMETFPIVRRKDIAAHGTYRTKQLILDAYDRIAAQGSDGRTPTVTPPPGHGPRLPS
ncbi:hypothetical protein Ade02nite_14730 [Paractinoplanes deccanensis]|uniref:site-specific DNA-methyltransferase (adenine-specific) n=1 Tax=Paractinoplanes deccanensis TaxID=113561 RepID=A0ABQ3XYU6_9ACTN|nr:DNA methyltransferase [Actinoplanes deccanensis]GID72832.1 hypothetical protein Ade02nite_14730 [Actinoplanes deccanensis]